MSITKEIVDKSFERVDPDQLLDDLTGELTARNYRITRINNIDNILERKISGEHSDKSFQYYKIIEFCNLNNCSKLISYNLLTGVFLPTRYILYQKRNSKRVHLVFLKPTAFARLFNSREMLDLTKPLEEDMNAILSEIEF